MKKAGALLFSALFAISEVLSGSAQAAPEYTLSLNLPIPPHSYPLAGSAEGLGG